MSAEEGQQDHDTRTRKLAIAIRDDPGILEGIMDAKELQRVANSGVNGRVRYLNKVCTHLPTQTLHSVLQRLASTTIKPPTSSVVPPYMTQISPVQEFNHTGSTNYADLRNPSADTKYMPRK